MRATCSRGASADARPYRRTVPDGRRFAARLLPPADGRPRRRGRLGARAATSCSARVLASFTAEDLDHAIALANDTRLRAERLAVHARPAQRARLRAADRGRARARERRHHRRRSARAVRRREGVELRAAASRGRRRASSTPRSRRCRSVAAERAIGSMAAPTPFPTACSVVDSHTEGEPTRVVVAGWPELAGADDGRRGATSSRALRPPPPRRGAASRAAHDAMVGALLTPPVTPGAGRRRRLLQQRRPTSACAATASSASCARSSTSAASRRARCALDTPVGTVSARSSPPTAR